MQFILRHGVSTLATYFETCFLSCLYECAGLASKGTQRPASDRRIVLPYSSFNLQSNDLNESSVESGHDGHASEDDNGDRCSPPRECHSEGARGTPRTGEATLPPTCPQTEASEYVAPQSASSCEAKTCHRKKLLDFWLEGCTHSKKFSQLERVKVEQCEV